MAFAPLPQESPAPMKNLGDDESIEEVPVVDPAEIQLSLDGVVNQGMQEERLNYKHTGMQFLQRLHRVASLKSSAFLYSTKMVASTDIHIEQRAKSEEARACEMSLDSVDSGLSTDNVVHQRRLPSLAYLVRRRPIWDVKMPLTAGWYLFIATIIVFGTQLVELSIAVLDCSQPQLLGGEYFYRPDATDGYTSAQEAWEGIWKNHPTFKFTNRLDQRFYCSSNPDSTQVDPVFSALVAIPMSLICIAVLYAMQHGDIRMEIFLQLQKVTAVLLIAFDVDGACLLLGMLMIVNVIFYHYTDRLLPKHRLLAKVMFGTLFFFCAGITAIEFVDDIAEEYITAFGIVIYVLVTACLIAVVVQFAYEYQDLTSLLADDFDMVTQLCRK